MRCWLGGALLAAALVCVAGCGHAADSATTVAKATPAADPAANPAADRAAKPAVPRPVLEAEFTTEGPLVVEQQADVAAERDGRVVSIRAEIGDRVRKGQVLALLDDRELEAARASHAARLQSLKAQVKEWQSEQQAGEADLRRADVMLANHIISLENWEHVKYKLDETIAEVARYRADQDAAEADLHGTEIELEQSRIAAPFAGVVGRRSIRVAQQVKKGDALFWVTAEGPLRVVFTVPEGRMAAFHTGAKLELTTADYPGLRQTARVMHVSPVVDPASGSVEVIGEVTQPAAVLKPGMSMQVRLEPGR